MGTALDLGAEAAAVSEAALHVPVHRLTGLAVSERSRRLELRVGRDVRVADRVGEERVARQVDDVVRGLRNRLPFERRGVGERACATPADREADTGARGR